MSYCINSLFLSNFRCYEKQTINFDPSPYFLVGNNGAGKTSILEGISMLALGKGMLNAEYKDVIMKNKEAAYVSATLSTSIGKQKLEASVLSKHDNKYVKVISSDGNIIKGPSSQYKPLDCVWVVPQMDNFFTESSQARRKFIDKLIYIIDKSHISLLNKYETTLRERNKLIISSLENNSMKQNKPWIKQLNWALAQFSVAISIYRNNFITNINKVLLEVSDNKIQLKFEGLLEEILNKNKYAKKTEELVFDILEKNDTKFFNIGVNRSKLVCYSYENKRYASTYSRGEQKKALLEIIISFVKIIISKKQTPPILLLDEIAVHLDEPNFHKIIKELLELKVQFFITSTTSHSVADKYNIPTMKV